MSDLGSNREGIDSTADTSPPSEPSALDPSRALVGQTLGDFFIKRLVGHGSMGVVFEAEQRSLKRRVALKILPPSLTLTDRVIQRFLREAESVARLSHENIVSIFDIGHDQNVYYYAMQFVDGEALDRTVAREKLSAKDGARMIAQAARAIHFAHQQGIIHRDVKPSNIIVDYTGKLLITDFGLARPEKSSTITESGALVGTPVYMSPEQVRGSREEIDRRTDVYSLGATLYEILTGQPAFSGNTTQEILTCILDSEPRSPRKVRPGLPWELEVITLKAMEKNVNRRYQTALAMADDIERFLNGETILARPSGVFYRSWKRMRKHKEITALLIAVLALAIVIPVQMMRGRATSRESKFEMSLANAQSLLKQGNEADALREFAQALELKPNDLDAIEGQSLALYHQASQREQAAERAAKDSPHHKSMMEEATRLFREAFDKLKVAASRDSKNGAVYLALGEVIWRLGNSGDVIESLTDIEKAGAMSRDSYDVQLGVARYYMNFVLFFSPPKDQQLQLLDRAYEHANAAVQVKGDRQDEELASALLIRAEIAIERCQRAMASGGASTFTRYYELAKDDVRRASLINPKDYLARKLDEMLKDVGEKNQKTLGMDWRVKLAELGLSSDFARGQWDNTAELRSSASKVLSSFLGQENSSQQQGQREGAEELARQARQADQANQKSEALDKYAAAFALNPEMADLAWRGSQLALELGDHKRARDLILSARRIAPANPLYMQADVEIALAVKDNEHAAKVLEQLMMLYPDTFDYFQRLLAPPAAPGSDQH